MKSLWHRLFLVERSVVSLSLFRIAVALTTGAHVIPSFFHLEETYFSTAFKENNSSFFPPEFIQWIAQSPQWLIIAFVWLFCIACFFLLIGFLSQLSCILLTCSCYYFYALNSFHIGTLSWDILLVTLFLMCLTDYYGEYFSVDCLLRGTPEVYQTRRPFFQQRLLQFQIGFTFLYTAAAKVWPHGNWLTANPMHAIMNYPPSGTTKWFLLRDWLMQAPKACYRVGLLMLVIEFLLIFLLFNRRTRISAIYLGVVFHVILILTLDVPAIFFFLFPPQLLLFIDPQSVLGWIEQKRAFNQNRGDLAAPLLIYDGRCHFCREWIKRFKIMDLFATLKYVDLHSCADLRELHPQLTKEKALSQMCLLEPGGQLWGGFDVFRRICFSMPMLYGLIPVFYCPGMGVVGPAVYRFVATHRYLFHSHKSCKDNSCFIQPR